MTADVFVDTNILLYSIDDNQESASKREAARHLLLTEHWGWSVQIVSEFFVNATSPRRQFRLAVVDAKSLIETWLAYPIADITPAIVHAAIGLHERYGLSYWDACVISAARQMSCHTVFSEDLNDGQTYDGVQVINPFRSLTQPSPAPSDPA